MAITDGEMAWPLSVIRRWTTPDKTRHTDKSTDKGTNKTRQDNNKIA